MILTHKDWRIIDLINSSTNTLQKYNISNARLEAEWMLCHVLQCKRIDLYINFEQIPHEKNLVQLTKMLKRRLSYEPLQHIIGKGTFYGRDYFVNKNVLVPRPETELIIEEVKNFGKYNCILDVGTGSGCLAITISLENLAKNIYATDISEQALKIAKQNAQAHKVNNIKFKQHDFLNSSFNKKFDIIVCNPPYIAKKNISTLDKVVRSFDPHIALSDNLDGLSFYRRFSKLFNKIVNQGGKAILEFGGNKQKNDIENIFKQNNLKTTFIKDLQHDWRVVIITNA